MKKFLYCLVFLVAFSGISSAVMLASGFDGAERQVKSEISSYQELEQEEKASIEAELSESVNNKGRDKIVYDVVLFEFSDYRGYYTEDKINRIERMFNDTDPNNTTFSVYEYFQAISYNQVEVNANFILHKDGKNKEHYDLDDGFLPIEYATYTKAKIKGTRLTSTYGDANASMIVFSAPEPDASRYSTRLWAHAFSDTTFVSLTYGAADVGTLCHEIIHTFGFKDLYTQDPDTPTPVDWWDLNASGSHYNANNLMYTKYVLDWVDVSNYGDSEETEIETITQNGRYTLSPTISTSGTRAYKFGMKRGDKDIYFMAEYRTGDNQFIDQRIIDGLIVYRVNENKKNKGNYNKSYKDFEIYLYRSFESDSCSYASMSRPTNVCGSLTNSSYYLYYEDKSIAKYIIDNISIDKESNTLSFDFKNYENTTYVAGAIYDNKAIKLENADIYINGTYSTTTNYKGEFIATNITPNSTLTVVYNSGSKVLKFNPIIIEPNTLGLKVFAEASAEVKISVKEGLATDTYKIYKFKNGSWVLYGTFTGDSSYLLKDVMCGEKCKVTGNLVEYEFLVDKTYKIVRITKAEPKVEEEKGTLEKITDTVTSIPGKVKNTLVNTYDSIKGAFSGFVDKVRSFF